VESVFGGSVGARTWEILKDCGGIDEVALAESGFVVLGYLRNLGLID